MTGRRGNGPGTLYAQMIARPVDGTLNRDTRPTKREHLLEVFLVALARAAGKQGLRVSREALLAADDAVEAGLRVRHRYQRGTHTLHLPDQPSSDDPDAEQQTLA